MVKVAINGFGRIGKLFFLAAMENKAGFDFVINELGGIDSVVYGLKYDSVHPMPKVKVSHDGTYLYYGGKKIRVYSEMDAAKLPWAAEKIDLVVDCSGAFTEAEKAKIHIASGAKKVLISAPAKGHEVTIVYGVNNEMLKKENTIISAGSCTTNCISPLVKILNDNYKIKSCYFVTTHAYTATQKLIDGADKKDMRRGRSAALNTVPSTSGASQSVVESIPELKGKLEGYALRIPVVDGSISSIIAEVEKPAVAEEVNILFKNMAETKYKGIVQYSDEPLVTSDIIHNPNSVILDSELTSTNGNLISIAGWYDNEWGYSCRLLDVARLSMGKKSWFG